MLLSHVVSMRANDCNCGLKFATQRTTMLSATSSWPTRKRMTAITSALAQHSITT